MGAPVEFTETNLISFIAYLSLCKYAHYKIKTMIWSLRYFPGITDVQRSCIHEDIVATVLQNVQTRIKKEDTRLPMTEKQLTQICSIYDRDLTLYDALMYKGAAWLALLCMLCIGEYSETSLIGLHHILTLEQVDVQETGVMVTFRQWK